MRSNRRQFMILAAAVALPVEQLLIGVVKAEPASRPAGNPSGVVDIGLLTDYREDGVYSAFHDAGVFVIRRNKQLFALSSICTHRGCKVRAQEDQSFRCKCHGSTFDQDGHVTKQPATRDLPRLTIAQTADGRVLVDTKQPVTPG